MNSKPSWEHEGRDWPNRKTSRFVETTGLKWHVQQMGAGPQLLLLHGTGAATHSWRKLMPLLAEQFSVTAPDLPGHGFTEGEPKGGLSLPGISNALKDLFEKLNITPDLTVGHSAGAAILIHMTIDGKLAPAPIISINGALLPFSGFAGSFFRPIAQLLFLNPFVPSMFAWSASDRSRVERLLRNTGSKIEPFGVELYERLFKKSGHVAGALGMMANWDLETLKADLPKLKVPLILLAAGNDMSVPSSVAFEVRDLVKQGKVTYLKDLGHLAHEEASEQIVEVVLAEAQAANILT